MNGETVESVELVDCREPHGRWKTDELCYCGLRLSRGMELPRRDSSVPTAPTGQKNRARKPTKTRNQAASNNTNPGLRKARETTWTLTTYAASQANPVRSHTAPTLRKRSSLGLVTYEELHTKPKTFSDDNMASSPGYTHVKKHELETSSHFGSSHFGSCLSSFVRVIFVVLHLITRDRRQMALGILRLKSNFAWRETFRVTNPPFEPAKLQRVGPSLGCQSAMPRCGRRPRTRSQRRSRLKSKKSGEQQLSRKRGCSRRLWRREAGAQHAGCGRDVGTHSSLLAAAIRHARPRSSRGRRSTQRHACKHHKLQHCITQFQLPSQLPFPVSQARQGAGVMRGQRVLVQLVLLMILAAFTSWGCSSGRRRCGPSPYSSCLSINHNSSFAHRALSTFQSAVHTHSASISVTWHRTFLCLIANSCHA